MRRASSRVSKLAADGKAATLRHERSSAPLRKRYAVGRRELPARCLLDRGFLFGRLDLRPRVIIPAEILAEQSDRLIRRNGCVENPGKLLQRCNQVMNLRRS
jgi:hypothetical protein